MLSPSSLLPSFLLHCGRKCKTGRVLALPSHPLPPTSPSHSLPLLSFYCFLVQQTNCPFRSFAREPSCTSSHEASPGRHPLSLQTVSRHPLDPFPFGVALPLLHVGSFHLRSMPSTSLLTIRYSSKVSSAVQSMHSTLSFSWPFIWVSPCILPPYPHPSFTFHHISSPRPSSPSTCYVLHPPPSLLPLCISMYSTDTQKFCHSPSHHQQHHVSPPSPCTTIHSPPPPLPPPFFLPGPHVLELIDRGRASSARRGLCTFGGVQLSYHACNKYCMLK